MAPLTVVYGPNGSGKSSLIYGLLTLRNFLTKPNQNVPSLFSYPSISLGGLHEIVHRHSNEKVVVLSIGVSSTEQLSARFTLKLDETGGALDLSFDELSVLADKRIVAWPHFMSMDMAVPYRGNQRTSESFTLNGNRLAEGGAFDLAPSMKIPGLVDWNGINVTARLTADVASYSDLIPPVNQRANLPMEMARLAGFVPLGRGFSNPEYNMHQVSPWLGDEDEVASLLVEPSERFVQYEISKFVEKISGRRIQPQPQLGTSTFSIDSIPIGGGVPTSIVNEGFGINQLVYMLTICLYSRYKIVAIEEPEIHLHPSMVRELAIALAEIAKEKDRRLIISTHSETFVVALLSQIAAGKINVDDVSFVLAENPNGSTVLTQQKANRNGQIKGGLPRIYGF